MLRRLAHVVVAFAILAARPAPAQERRTPPPVPTPAKGVDFKPAIVYASPGGEDQLLDLYIPADGGGPFPLIVCIHGGGWATGSRSLHARECNLFATHGYVAATIDYRLLPHKFPAQIEDVRNAVRFLKAHAKEYKIEPGMVGAFGFSSGAHLTLLLALSGNDPDELKRADAPSACIQAAVNKCGGSDFRIETDPKFDPTLMDLLGTTDRDSGIFRRVSPITYVDKDDPPILSFYGEMDPIVKTIHGDLLHKALKAAGVREQLVIVPGGGHGNWGAHTPEKSDEKMLEFFDEILKSPASKPATKSE